MFRPDAADGLLVYNGNRNDGESFLLEEIDNNDNDDIDNNDNDDIDNNDNCDIFDVANHDSRDRRLVSSGPEGRPSRVHF